MSEGSKYINLLSRDLKSNKSGFKKFIKEYLLKLVCRNFTLANFQLEQIIKKYVIRKNSNLNIIDIGAGLCNFFPETSSNSKIKYIACDLSKNMEANLAERGIDFLQADISKDYLNLEERSFDLIICSHLIEHLDSPINLLSEAERILKKSGILFIKTPDIKTVKWNFYNDFTHIKPYSKTSLIQQTESEKLKIEKCVSTTLYLDFSLKLLKTNPFNPFNIIFFFIGIYTFYFRKDMRELFFIARKIKD